jgi:hypothetical protein
MPQPLPSFPDAPALGDPTRIDPARDDPSPPPTGEGTPPRRQCGRCRGLFAGDPDAHPTALPDWWLCPPCRAVLMGAPGVTGR